MMLSDEINGKLKNYGEKVYEITHPRMFEPVDQIQRKYVLKCLEFSYEMSYGQGEHRTYRSGGDKRRKAGEIFANTLQGKLAEYGMYQFMQNNGIESKEPDLSVEGLGKWDTFDLEYNGMLIAVKSTKYYGQLLLLETADWNFDGSYIPNYGNEGEFYDYIVLLRIKPSCEMIMKQNRLLYSECLERQEVYSLFFNLVWEYDIAGVISNRDLRKLISKGYILPKGAKLNGNTTMDAENYYVQSGDMRNELEFIKRIKAYKKRVSET